MSTPNPNLRHSTTLSLNTESLSRTNAYEGRSSSEPWLDLGYALPGGAAIRGRCYPGAVAVRGEQLSRPMRAHALRMQELAQHAHRCEEASKRA